MTYQNVFSWSNMLFNDKCRVCVVVLLAYNKKCSKFSAFSQLHPCYNEMLFDLGENQLE